MENKLYDITIIGAGPAGMTAAIYTGRANKTVAIVDKDGFGGQIAKSPKVENIPGFVSISGIDFAASMYEQISSLETVDHVLDNAVLIQFKRGVFITYLESGKNICSKTIIFATGCKPKQLNLDTKNIYYCVTCDGPFFKNKDVIVLGSGNTGATYALELASYCKHVYLCDITLNLMCEPVLVKRIASNDKITFLANSTIKSVKNDKDGELTSVSLNTGSTIKVKAIFSALGMIPQTELASALTILKNDYIESSSVPGVFAAGDCTVGKIKQVTTACASGTAAAINAINYLNSLE